MLQDSVISQFLFVKIIAMVMDIAKMDNANAQVNGQDQHAVKNFDSIYI